MRNLTLVVLLTMTAPALGQDALGVLPADSEPRKMLYRFHLAQAAKHFDARRQTVAALKTPEDIYQRQEYLKARFVQALGGFPDKKSPLKAKVVGVMQGDGFRVEKVIFESRPHHHVTANFYLPDNRKPKEKLPGVLVPCGHSANGKAAEAYQKACILLAKHGMAALCYDPIGQGERSQLLAPTGKPAIAGSTSEHTMAGVGALLVGKSTATYRIWDGIRALDYLAGRPEVDGKRLGCTGNSGGGTLTAYLMALDDRIVCAAPSCYITSLERLFATLGPQDAEQNITGQVAFGMEHADYVTMRAPRPTLICTATQDFFDIQGSWTTYREASLIYAKLGYGERVSLFEYDDKHGFTRPRREAAARWLARWLLTRDYPIKEGPWLAFKDADLQCTRSGQVLEDYRGKSVFHFNADEARALAPRRAGFVQLNAKDRADRMRALLGLPQKIPAAKTTHHGSSERGPGFVYKVIFDTEPGIKVPGLWITAAKKGTNRLVIYLSERGIAEDAQPGGALAKLVKDGLIPAGMDVLALDLRGLGETAPGLAKAGKPAYFGVDFKDAFLGIHLNRPLLGQRVYDVLAVLNKVAENVEEIHLVGAGTAGPAALHTAVLDPRIRRVTLLGALLSWTTVVETPISHNQLTNVVPGVLKVYDLPELAASLAPRPLAIHSPVDAQNRPVPAAILETAYRPCLDAFSRHKAEKSLVLSVGP